MKNSNQAQGRTPYHTTQTHVALVIISFCTDYPQCLTYLQKCHYIYSLFPITLLFNFSHVFFIFLFYSMHSMFFHTHNIGISPYSHKLVHRLWNFYLFSQQTNTMLRFLCFVLFLFLFLILLKLCQVSFPTTKDQFLCALSLSNNF